MTNPPRRTPRLVLALLLVAAAVAASAYFLTSSKPPVPEMPESLLVTEADGFRYEYHVPTGREALYDVKSDPRHVVNVLSQNKEAAAKCRRALEQKMNVPDLETLRSRYEAEIRRLHALGYL